MHSSTARVVAIVLAAPALGWALTLLVAVTADLPQLGGAALGLPLASVALLSLLGAIAASIAARLGREHRGDAPPRRLVAATVSGTVLVAAAGLALVLGGTVTPAPALAEPASEVVEQGIVFGDHTGHFGYTP